MRAVTVVLFVCLAFVAVAQSRQGTYLKTPWSINDNHTLIWAGQPYVPVGIEIDGTPEAVEGAHAAKVKDVIVDLPASGLGWRETINALEDDKMRYLIRIDSLAPMAHGFVIEPQGYRIDGITEPRHISLPLPGVDSAFLILALKRDGTIESQARVPVINGMLEYDAKPGPSLEHVLLIYPEMDSAELPDYWESMDSHRDQLLAAIHRGNPGAGFRGLIDPIGRTVQLPGRDLAFAPTSPFFRMEMRNYLEQTYKSVQTATRSWAIGASDLTTFDQIAKLVPLWNGDRGVAEFLDPTTNKLYPTDRRYSNAWGDMATVIQLAGAKRFDRLVTSIRTQADVPVIQEWAGWSSPYESETPAVDGVGMRSQGTAPSKVAESACRATSSVLRWKTKGWLVATDVDMGKGDTKGQLPVVLDELSSLGARAFFLRAETPDLVAAANQEAERKAADTTLPTVGPQAVFYPENATNPANPQMLAGGSWWLPTPSDGNRIDLGSLFYGYRMTDKVVIWAVRPGRYKLRMANPKNATFQSCDGHLVDPKLDKDGVEVNLTQMPLTIAGTDEVPIPEIAFAETLGCFDTLLKQAETQQKDVLDESLAFKSALATFDQNPGGTFPVLRTELYRLGYKMGDFTWLECERTTKTNFSEAAVSTGASAGKALVLDTRIAPTANGYYAEYDVPVRTVADQEVWLAAKIPAGRRSDVSISVGGQHFRLPAEPLVLYGDGFGWYKLGTTKLAGGQTKIRIDVGTAGEPIAADVILLSSKPFTPNAVTPPLPIQLPSS